jgi:hypothetical protein
MRVVHVEHVAVKRVRLPGQVAPDYAVIRAQDFDASTMIDLEADSPTPGRPQGAPPTLPKRRGRPLGSKNAPKQVANAPSA